MFALAALTAFSVPTQTVAKPAISSCAPALTDALTRALLDSRLIAGAGAGSPAAPKYACIRFKSDLVAPSVAVYIGDVSAGEVDRRLPLVARTPLAAFHYRDLTLVVVPPGSEGGDQGALESEHLRKSLKGGAKFDWESAELQTGLNLVAGVDLSKSALVKPFEALGISKGNLAGWTLTGSVGLDLSGVIKSGGEKRGYELNKDVAGSIVIARGAAIRNLFGVAATSLADAKIKVEASQSLKQGGKPEAGIALEGSLTYRNKTYDLFAHSGGALSLDTEKLSLAEFLDAVELAGLAMRRPGWKNLRNTLKLPDEALAAITFTRKKPACREMALTFSRAMIAASPSGDGVPDDVDPDCPAGSAAASQHRTLVAQFAGFEGPAVAVNGALTLFGHEAGHVNASFTGTRGLDMDVGLPTFKLAGLDLKEARFRAYADNPAKGLGAHSLAFIGRASILDLYDGELRIAVENGGYRFAVPPNCPLVPTGVTASTGGLDLRRISDFGLSFKLEDCYSKAIIATLKDPKKLGKAVESLAEDSVEFAESTVRTIGTKIVNADRTWKEAWKASVDVGQTAVNTVKSIDKTVAKLGHEIQKVGKAIEDLGKEIKKLAEKIGDFFAGKLTQKKREKKAKEATKRTLEAQRVRAEADRRRANAALGRVAPQLDPAVMEARDARAALYFERKQAEARKTYAATLRENLKKKSFREALIRKHKIDVDAIVADRLGDALRGGSLVTLAKAGATPAKRLADGRAQIETAVMAALFEKEMDDLLAKLAPDAEKEVPYDTPVRIVGRNDLCVVAYARISGKSGFAAIAEQFQQKMLRLAPCETYEQKKVGHNEYATQRFTFTAAGKLVALFDKRRACFKSEIVAVRTIACVDDVSQIFFYDPTVEGIRPLDAKGRKEARCLHIHGPARPGASIELHPCQYQKENKQWRFVHWSEKPPKRKATAPLPSLWVNYGGSFQPATIGKSGNVVTLGGLIRIKAQVRGGKPDHAEPITRLARGFRPAHRLIFNVSTEVFPTRIDIFPDGMVRWIAGSTANTWASLAGITFPVGAGTSLPVAGGCSNHTSDVYAAPGYVKSGSTVTLTGLIRCSSWTTGRNLVTLPAGARPKARLVFNVSAHERSARVDVLPNGDVKWVAGGGARHGWVSLNGISFTLPDKGVRKVRLLGECKAYGKGFGEAAVARDAGLIRLSGLIRCPFHKGERDLVELPSAYRPSKAMVFDLNMHGESARADVLPDGIVRFKNAPYFLPFTKRNDATWISLDGIVFPDRGSDMALKW